MTISDFTSAELTAINAAIDFMDFEMEDSTDRPSGWTYKHYCDVSQTFFRQTLRTPDSLLSHDELVYLSFILRIYMESKELDEITRDVPASFEEAVAARKRILSQLYA